MPLLFAPLSTSSTTRARHEHEHSSTRPRTLEHSSTRPRALEHSSTRARTRRAVKNPNTHHHSSTRALEHEHSTRALDTSTRHEHDSTRALEHGHEHESTRARVVKHEVARQSMRAVSGMTCETRRSFFFIVYVGLHAPGWLYVLRMPPRGYLPIFPTPRARATELGQGPNLRRGFRAGSPHAPEPRAREKPT